MKLRKDTMKLSTLALAITSALVSMQVRADESEEAALKMPASSIGIGATAVSDSSAKFGEYNGLNRQRAYLNLSVDARGGSAYADNLSGGLTRWSITGADLGLTSRSFSATVSEQGAWNLGIGYDALRHNISDSYQTPYEGKMGGNKFTLPAGFGTTGVAPAANTNSLTAAQLQAFHNVDIHTTRENTSFSAARVLSKNFSVNLDFNHLEQSGAKLMAFGAAKSGSITGEAVSILPMPTNYQTETVNLALNWAGEKGRLTGSYLGSFFHDSAHGVQFQTFASSSAGVTAMQTMSTAPSNDLHQLSLDGNYAFSSKTKLIGNISRSRNTQNDPYVVDAGLMIVPQQNTSLGGLVMTQNANLKLINQSVKDLTLSAGYKYNERDNKTASSIYQFYAINGSNPTNYPSTPLSTKKSQYEVAGDYRIVKNNAIRVAYTHEEIDRWCNQYATNAAYPAGTNCVVAKGSAEDKIDSSYRIKAADNLDLKLGYAYGERKTDSDLRAKTAFSTNSNGLSNPGINGGDVIGFYPYFDASRKQQLVKASSNWQATETLSFSLGGRYSDDQYTDSNYGVQNGRGWGLNADSTYAYSDKGSVSLYATQQHRERDLTSVNSATTYVSWSNKLKDDDLSFGLGIKHIDLVGGKLDLSGDFNYMIGKTGYSTQVPYLATCSAAATLTCGSLPDIKSRSAQFKLTGNYKLDKSSTIQMQYIYARFVSSDYYYNGYQTGTTPNAVLPTNQQAPEYSIHTIAAMYIHNF